jgi:poly-gamma-glutamate synthesis protein (capsule biosynthesis protein)
MIRIVIGGDICPMGRIQNAFIEGNADQIFHDLLEEIASAGLSVVNLECPLVSKETPIEKAGGTILGARINCINGFVASNWNVLNLANNHSFDHGARGLQETIQAIEGAGLAYVGAGSNIEEAQKPFIKEINGERVVIYSMAEREFSIADEKTPGANPLDLINFVNAIRQHKQQGIFIVLVHGGKENYPYPSPEMVRRCRFMVDMGADAVICCHAHCPLPWEIYADRPIVYGLGNLIFEALGQEQDDWYVGYLARLSIEDEQVHLEVIPYFQSHVHLGAKKMDEKARKRFFNEMERKNNEVKDSVFLEDRWLKYCRQQRAQYLEELFGYNRLMSKARNLLLRTLHSKKEVLNALLLTQCETHKEILNTIFKDERKGDNL